MIGDLDGLAADLDRRPRDPAWSPGAEAGLRDAFPGPAAPIAADCRTGPCRVSAHVPAGLAREEADRALATLQARTAGQLRTAAPFRADQLRVEQSDETGEATFTAYLQRR